MPEKIDKAICIALKEAISDERAAPPMYEKLIELLGEKKVLTVEQSEIIRDIIEQEKNHEKVFITIADEVGCELSTVKEPRKLYADLPLVERIKLARESVSRMEEILGK